MSENHRPLITVFTFLSLLLAFFCNFCAFAETEDRMEWTEGLEMCTYRRFNVIDENGKVAATVPILDSEHNLPLWAEGVSQLTHDWQQLNPDEPYFDGPVLFVRPPLENSGEPFYSHNHQPDVTWLPNGDLLAIWYSTPDEWDTAFTVLASRLRAGSDKWDLSSEFFKAENRNMHGNSVFYDSETGVLHHVNGMGPEGTSGYRNLAILHRFSLDSGVTWSTARAISSGAVYGSRHQVIAGMLRTQDGTLIQPCDATHSASGDTAIHFSQDGGRTWNDPGGNIRGIHANLVELNDRRLLAFARGRSIRGRAPMSVSEDLGKTWTYSASVFPPIGGGQRSVLLRLNEGPLFFASFTSQRDRDRLTRSGMSFTDANGEEYDGYGLFAALSYDEGATWQVRKLITPGIGEYEGLGGGGGRTPGTPWEASPTRAEPAGYLAATQTPDGVIHLVSSLHHYRFNLKWVETPADPVDLE